LGRLQFGACLSASSFFASASSRHALITAW
jgi:hypothetical protein